METRGNGAIDLALWDLLGKRAGLPVVDLLGGAVRDRARAYNTCAGPGYVRASSRQTSENWGLGAAGGRGRLEDLEAFLHRPGELARELWAEGLRGMKVWPFDQAAERTGRHQDPPGAHPLPASLGRGPSPPGRRRRPRPAGRRRRGAIATGETCVGRRGFLPLLQRGAVGVVTVDVGWTGGLTEARKVATLADAYGVPVAPHDCTGPVALAACVHLVLSQPNGLVQETVRAFLRTWYGDLATGLPAVQDGYVAAPTEPGLGVRLREGLGDRPDVARRVTSL